MLAGDVDVPSMASPVSTQGTSYKINVKQVHALFNLRVTEKMSWILANTAGTFDSACAALN